MRGDKELTKPFTSPPVWLFDGREFHFRVQPEAVIQVSGPTLGLPNDVEVWQAAQAEVLPVHM